MESDPAKPTPQPTDDGGTLSVDQEKKPETQITEASEHETADPVDLEKEKASGLFQSYMQSFSNKQIMSVYGQKHLEELVKKKREFWDSQPVPKTKDLIAGDLDDVHGPLEKKTVEDVRKEPYPLPAGFEWGIVDLDNDAELEELFDHLYNHYVEDEDGYFRFRYGKGFIKWALTPPGYEKDLLISIKESKTGKMVSFIAGVVINLRVG